MVGAVEMRFHVPDMSCNHCVKTIGEAIKAEILGAQIEADLTQHILTVTGADDEAQVSRIIVGQDYECEIL